MSQARLTQKEKELVAVGAAISAGCQKCANYHFKKAFEEGNTREEIQKAVEAATCVIKSSDEIMQRKAYSLMNVKRKEVKDSCTDHLDRINILVKIGAAVAANNATNITKYIDLATFSGIMADEMTVTIKLAKAILKKAGEFAEDATTEALSNLEEKKVLTASQ